MGIDIGKFTFVVGLHGQKDVKEFENNSKGIQSFMREFKATLPASLVVLETTGGYEMEVLNALFAKKIQENSRGTGPTPARSRASSAPSETALKRMLWMPKIWTVTVKNARQTLTFSRLHPPNKAPFTRSSKGVRT